MTTRVRLVDRRASEPFQFEHRSVSYTATVSHFGDGRLAEIFLDHSQPNSELAEHTNDAAVLASLLLQHGVTAAAIRHSISGPLATALALAEERAL
jgi:C4-dicarboxylate-specific signal transduction histidine kinase